MRILRATGKSGRNEDTGPLKLLDVARALLSDDDAAALEREREQAARVTAERAETDAAKRREAAVAKWIKDECRRQGYWWPSDYR